MPSINYEKIKQSLVVGDWSQADRKTHILILKISGREREKWLEVKDIATFPDEILQQLDPLWLHWWQVKEKEEKSREN